MDAINQLLLAACRKIITPLIRVLVRHGISHGEFSELARRVYVEVAWNDFDTPARHQTVSRVSVLTGLSRKDVLRINRLAEAPVSAPHMNRAARVIAGWIQDQEFVDEQGTPLVLPLNGEAGSFAALVKRFSGDITAATILEELIRVGAVELKEDKHVRLLTKGYVPSKSKEDQIRIMGICTQDLLETIDYNMTTQNDKKRLQRAVVYNHIPVSTALQFKQLSEAQGEELIVNLNRWLREKRASLPQNSSNEPTYRVGMGIYYFENEDTKVTHHETRSDAL